MRLTDQDWEWIGRIAGLSERKRRIMAFRYVAQLSAAAIAQLEGITESTARVHIHQAWVRLQTFVWPEDLKAFATLLMEINEQDLYGEEVPISRWEEVTRLLWCYRNSQPGGNPLPPFVDSKGRKVCGMPIIAVEDFLKTNRLTA